MACFSYEYPYLVLDKYMTKAVDTVDLKANVKALMLLIEFEALAIRFGHLVDDEESKLCSGSRLDGLRFLINEAMKYDKTSMNPHTDAKRLNQLLLHMKHSVQNKCYGYLDSEWSEGQGKPTEIGAEEEPIIRYLNSNVRFDLFKRLIYRPEDTPEASSSNDYAKVKGIIFNALLVHPKRLSSPEPAAITYLQKRVERLVLSYFIDPSRGITMGPMGFVVLRPAITVLKVGMMAAPGQQNLPDLKQTDFEIDSLPTYVICEKYIFKKREHPDLISNTQTRLMAAVNGQEGYPKRQKIETYQ